MSISFCQLFSMSTIYTCYMHFISTIWASNILLISVFALVTNAACFSLQEYERRIADMEEAREKALQELTEHYEVKLEEMKLQLEQASDEQRHQLKESEELQRQTEEDADREILDVKNNYERKLRQRWEENTKLRGEVGILSKKVGSLQEEIKMLKDEIQRLKQEVKKRDGIIASLKTDIDGLKKEIQERDDTIQDKVLQQTYMIIILIARELPTWHIAVY